MDWDPLLNVVIHQRDWLHKPDVLMDLLSEMCKELTRLEDQLEKQAGPRPITGSHTTAIPSGVAGSTEVETRASSQPPGVLTERALSYAALSSEFADRLAAMSGEYRIRAQAALGGNLTYPRPPSAPSVAPSNVVAVTLPSVELESKA